MSPCVFSISVLIPHDIGGTFFKIGARITSLWQKLINGSSALKEIHLKIAQQIWNINLFHNCEVALPSHFRFPIRLVSHQHLNSHIAYPGCPPEPSNFTQGEISALLAIVPFYQITLIKV